jgi:hypothetical protein
MPGMQVEKFHYKDTESTKIEVKGDRPIRGKWARNFLLGFSI